MNMKDMDKGQLQALKAELEQAYAAFKEKGASLNMARGKPCKDQLDLSNEMLKMPITEYKDGEGVDIRNYGGLPGIPEARKLFAEIMGVQTENVILGGTASLNLMYDMVSRAYTHGVLPGKTPWCKLDKVKFLCPSPGYDRHFAITEYFGFELIAVSMNPCGPDMDAVEELIKDPAVKGIWCVPMYSNPDGITYSDDTVRRLAAMKPAADDFRIFWDNAYGLHHLDHNDRDYLLNIYDECKKLGVEDRVYIFNSLSKITLAGGSISAMAMSKPNFDWTCDQLGIQTISYDKVNQLRHCRFFPNLAALEEHMKKHGAILKKKFDIVLDYLNKEIAPLGIGTWQNPKGGYFVSFFSLDGCAKRIIALCKEAGVVLTGAGATYPYGNDPHDSNIRIAPSFPPEAELCQAMDVFCVAVKLASVEKLLAE